MGNNKRHECFGTNRDICHWSQNFDICQNVLQLCNKGSEKYDLILSQFSFSCCSCIKILTSNKKMLYSFTKQPRVCCIQNKQ